MIWATAICIVAAVLTVSFATSRAWLGLHFAAGPGNSVVIADVALDGPARGTDAVPGFRVTGIGLGGEGADVIPIPLVGRDLTEEPDGLASYGGVATFLERQTALADLLGQAVLRLHVVNDVTAEARVAEIYPRDRPLSALPAVFWVQLFSGLAGFAIGAWVWAMRSSDIAARMFALSGLGLMVSALPAAIYSTRELAINGNLFAVLSALNHLGVHLFGGAMVALFLVYPRRLVQPRWLLLIPAVLIPWLWADVARLLPDPTTGMYVPMLAEMALIVILVAIQWWLARRDPAVRAALTWLGLSVVFGAGAFVAGIAVPLLLDAEPAVSQGNAFAFFLIVYGGIALGIRRYRLFELGDWAFRILFYAGGAALLMALDATLIWLLHVERGPALGVSLLLVGFAYLPLRDGLWRRIRGRQVLAEHELFAAALDVAFGPTPAVRSERWRRLLVRIYDPLETTPIAGIGKVTASADGLELSLPSVADETALKLRYPLGGKGMFGPRDRHLAVQLIALVSRAEASRDAYERGALEERQRIARDLHDDVGARLLTGLHSVDRRTRPILQAALSDIRAIVGGLNGETAMLDQVLAEARHETARRLEAADIALHWPLPNEKTESVVLDYRQSKALLSSVREIVSNIIRHAGAQVVRAEITLSDAEMTLRITDDGRGMASKGETQGYGLGNIQQRITSIGGTLGITSTSNGTAMEIAMPLGHGGS
jgi:signal transduction histidine kinase